MPYLLIENAGVAPVTAFTVLGATTTRNKNIPGIIGTFGSGANMGTLDLLRHDLPPIIYTSNTRLEFVTKPLTVQDVSGHITIHRQVYVKFGGTSTKTEKLSWTIAHGEKDWSSIDFALREYISNAIDAMLSQGIPLKNVGAYVNVEIVEDDAVRAKAGYTRVFVPVNEAVRNFMNHIDSWFLHFSEPESLGRPILEKFGRNISNDRGVPLQRAVIFRRGVRVREFMSDTIPSLYDYNLDDLDLNESRCVDDYAVMPAVGQALKKADVPTLARVFRSLIKGEMVWEARLPDYSLSASSNDNLKAINSNWAEALKVVVGEHAVVVSQDADKSKEQVKRKGYTPVAFPAPFVEAARTFNLLTDDKVLTEDDRLDREFFDANNPLKNTVDKIWGTVVKFKMTNGKEKPKCKLFWEHMNAECEKFGFYRDGTVFVHRDYATAVNDALDLTVIEEVCHYVTGATDCSRDFQQWLMRFLHAALFVRKK